MAREMHQRLGAAPVYAFQTAHVVFFLLPQAHHLAELQRGIATVEARWSDQMAVTVHYGA